MLKLLPIVVLLGCEAVVPPTFPTLDPTNCGAACRVLEKLDCRTSSGRKYTNLDPELDCPSACAKRIEQGVDLHPSCVAQSKDCAAVDNCAKESK